MVGTAVAFNVVAAPTVSSLVASTSTVSAGTSIIVPSGANVTLTAFVDTASTSAASSGGSSGANLTGAVTFTCTPAVTGCGTGTPATSFSSNTNTEDSNGFVGGLATLANVIPTATTTVTAIFTPTGVDYTGSTSNSATVTVSSATFTLAPLASAGTTLMISAPGQSANTPITVTSTGFTGNVTLTCAVAPAVLTAVSDLPTCAFSLSGAANNVVALAGNGTNGTRTLTVNTTAATSAVPPTRMPQGGQGNRFLPIAVVSLLALFLTALSFVFGAPVRKVRGVAVLGMLVVVVTLAMVSCNGGGAGSSSNGSSGGGGTNSGTTVTSYNVTVTATPSSGAAVQTLIVVDVN